MRMSMNNKKQSTEFSLTFNEDTLPILKQISEGMPGGFFIYHAGGDEDIIYINSAMLRIFGCDTEEEFRQLTGYTFKGMVHPDDIEEVEKSIAAQIINSVYDLDYVEYRIIRKDGSVRWIEDYGHFIRTKSYGDIFCVFIEDATERLEDRMSELEEINRELRCAYTMESQYKKAILYDAVSFFEVNLTRDEFITTATHDRDGNKCSLFELIGIPPFEKYSCYVEYMANNRGNESLAEYRNFFDRERLIQCYDRGEYEQTFDSWRADSPGRSKLFHNIILIGKNEYTGDIVALFIDKDMTEQAKNQSLLKSALKQAESANMARNTFLFNMSHDIRTPLNAIIGYTDLVMNHISDRDKVEDYIKKIRISGEQLLNIVNESLEVTRIESGRVNLTEKECNIETLLKEVEESIRPDAGVRDITFCVDSSGIKHPAVIADYIRIKEIMCQLLDNAVKYTGNGGTVRLLAAEYGIDFSGYGKYQFIVEDNGIGISDEFMQNLFEPFKRENNTTESGVLGFGLGLTVVKSLIDMMGGEIDVESKKGEGSRFTVNLLLRHQKSQSADDASVSEPVDNLVQEGRRILLVEDNEINCEIAQELLLAQGYIVETAENGSIALDMIKNSEPGYYSVILMDIQMPIMDGYEATRRIRQLEDKELADIPIIAVSANAFAEDYYKSIEAGMDAHFPKPIDINGLQELICSVLNSRRKRT